MTDSKPGRRDFLKTSALSASVAGLGGLAALSEFAPHSRAEMKLKPEDVRLRPDIAPLVKLIETTPREKLVGVMISQLKKGMSYRDFLTSLILAAARMAVSPHHVFMIHAAQEMSLDMRREERLLPLFWALDTVPHSRGEGTRYPKVDVSKVASTDKLVAELERGMQRYDFERAESAAIALARSLGPKQAMSRLWHFAARDHSYIGHRIIGLSNAWRTLNVIGWQHAEPLFQFVVRLTATAKSRSGLYWDNVAKSKTVSKLPAGWAGSKTDEKATLELLAVMRAGDEKGACRWVYDSLKKGTAQAACVWDAIYLCGAEFMIRFKSSYRLPGRPLHTNTSMNAMRFAFDTCRDPATRLYLLLQGVSWTTSFIATETRVKYLRDLKITEIPGVEIPTSADKAVESIFAQQPPRVFDNKQKRFISRYNGKRETMDRVSQMTFAFAKKHSDHTPFLQTARLLTCLKSTSNAHDMKFPAAIFENHRLVSRQWRPHLLAASAHWLHGSNAIDSSAVKQAREALKK